MMKSVNPVKKILLSLGLLVLMAVLLLNIVFYLRQPSMLFFPVAEHDGTPRDWDLPYADRYLESGSETIHGWFIENRSPMVVLFFHGNGGNISHRADTLQILHSLGVSILIIDYQGYGKSSGKPSESGMYENARTAWQYLTQTKKYKPEQIIIFGRSLGSAVAANLATEVNAAGVILESAFTSVRDMAGYVMPSLHQLVYLRYQFDTFSKIDRISSPLLIIHSADDEMIPFQLGVRLYQQARSEKAFLEIHGSHNSGFVDSLATYIPALKQFMINVSP